MAKKKKTTRIVSLCVVILLLAAGAIAGYQYFKYQEKVEMEKEKMLENLWTIQYAFVYRMDSNVDIVYCTNVRERLESEELKDKEILFVLEKPAIEDPDHIAIFPTDHTEIFLEHYNRYLRRENVDLNPYGLSYPLTMEDLLYKRDKIKALMDDTSGPDKRIIFSLD